MKVDEGRLRGAVISNVSPLIEDGLFPIKRVVGDTVTIEADIFTDGHQFVAANLLFRHEKQHSWQAVPMSMLTNDRWKGSFKVERLGIYDYTIHAWVDHFKSWQHDITKKFQSGLQISNELEIGRHFLERVLHHRQNHEIKEFLTKIKTSQSEEDQFEWATHEYLAEMVRDRYPNCQWITKSKILHIVVDSSHAQFSTWYEIFPRSFGSKKGEHGTFKNIIKLLPDILKLGFDVLYFPPIHPIGYTNRKGKNNQLKAKKEDPGSPWAIGSHEGGHKAVHPKLGTIEDFELLVAYAKQLGIFIALDIALHCSLDHPYVKEHPDWFCWRPDGTIQYAENPPKKYEDIVPFFFETKDWKALWVELRSIFIFWIEKGIKIFRVDNPHTKPFPFWSWLISSIKSQYPDIIFLSEAFTRPKVMYWLSKLGFTQSYTYFTWRHTKKELTDYFNEIVLSDIKEFFRPNLWPNTPDILTEELQKGGRPIFISRLVLAATLSSNYGMYAPAFELMVSKARPGTEEYFYSEKYQILEWKNKKNDLRSIIAHINKIRHTYYAFQCSSNLKFLEIENDQIIYYGKFDPVQSQAFLIMVNLDPFHAQTGKFKIPLEEFGITSKGSYSAIELLTNQYSIWEGEYQTITLDPQLPASIFLLENKLKREKDFDYFI